MVDDFENTKKAIRYCFESEREESNAGTDCPYNFNFMKLDLGTGDDDVIDDDDDSSNGDDDEQATDDKQQASNEEQMDTSEPSPAAELQNGETSILNDEDIAWPIAAAHVGEDCVAFSTKVAKWSIRCLGRPVHELQVDEVTSTEVLRITILSLAAEMKSQITNYR